MVGTKINNTGLNIIAVGVYMRYETSIFWFVPAKSMYDYDNYDMMTTDKKCCSQVNLIQYGQFCSFWMTQTSMQI